MNYAVSHVHLEGIALAGIAAKAASAFEEARAPIVIDAAAVAAAALVQRAKRRAK